MDFRLASKATMPEKKLGPVGVDVFMSNGYKVISIYLLIDQGNIYRCNVFFILSFVHISC